MSGKRFWSLSGRVFVVTLVALVIPLILQSGVLVYELMEAWKTTQFDNLVRVAGQRIGLARSWVADRALLTNLIDAQSQGLTMEQMSDLTPGARWVPIQQEGPLFSVDPNGPHPTQVRADPHLAHLLGDQILFVPSRRPAERGLLIPTAALAKILTLDEPRFPLELRARLGNWKAAQRQDEQIWIKDQEGSSQIASGALLESSNFYVLTLPPSIDQLPEKLRASGLRLTFWIASTILLGFVLSWLAVRRLSRPLNQLQTAMQRAGEGDWEQRMTPDPWAFELNALGQTFNSMLRNLRESTELAEQEQEQRLSLSTELHLGRQVQRALLPQRESRMPGVEIASWYQSARETGGDFYDYFGSPSAADPTLHLCVADVSGKGLAACLFSLTFRALFRAFSRTGVGLAPCVRQVNELLCWDTNSSGYFVTAWMAQLAADGTCLYISAGHPLAVIRRRDGGLEKLAPRGLALGVDRGYPYEQHETRLNDGDLLLIYTDGLIEQHNPQGEFFGEARLWECLKTLSHEEHPQDVILKIRRALSAFADGADPYDDLTMLALQKISQD
jgi:serine phosphatase RsbU (regulator of sigma subunit)